MTATPTRNTVLLVHGNQVELSRLKSALENSGHEVMAADNKNDAVALVQEKKPDLISIDLDMSGRAGIAFLHALRRDRQWSSIPRLTMRGGTGKDGRNNGRDTFGGKIVKGPRVYLESVSGLTDYLGLIEAALDPEGEFLDNVIDLARYRAAKSASLSARNRAFP